MSYLNFRAWRRFSQLQLSLLCSRAENPIVTPSTVVGSVREYKAERKAFSILEHVDLRVCLCTGMGYEESGST